MKRQLGRWLKALVVSVFFASGTALSQDANQKAKDLFYNTIQSRIGNLGGTQHVYINQLVDDILAPKVLDLITQEVASKYGIDDLSKLSPWEVINNLDKYETIYEALADLEWRLNMLEKIHREVDERIAQMKEEDYIPYIQKVLEKEGIQIPKQPIPQEVEKENKELEQKAPQLPNDQQPQQPNQEKPNKKSKSKSEKKSSKNKTNKKDKADQLIQTTAEMFLNIAKNVKNKQENIQKKIKKESLQ